MRRYAVWLMTLALPGCASPEVVGQRVGQSLYDASVNTGRALTIAGDRTGYALQRAGTSVRNAVSPPPYEQAPSDGFDDRPPVTATPLSLAY